MSVGQTECAKPGCTNAPEKTYRDSNGNRLRVCEKHYYRLVSNGIAGSFSSSLPSRGVWGSGHHQQLWE